MTQASPTPVPDHGTGWGLLLLFLWLYGTVALLGAGTVVAIVTDRLGRRVPRSLHYLLVAVLLGALGLAGFTIAVAARAGTYDVVALLLLIVFLPLSLVVRRHRGSSRGHLAVLARGAMAWSIPFLVGFGVIALAGTRGEGIPPAVTGVVAVSIVVGGTVVVDRLPSLPGTDRSGR